MRRPAVVAAALAISSTNGAGGMDRDFLDPDDYVKRMAERALRDLREGRRR